MAIVNRTTNITDEDAYLVTPAEQEQPKWYVIHTYSGYENRVKANIEKIIENRNMQELICQVAVPSTQSVEIKNNKKQSVERKIFPGYVFIKMIMNDDTWYVVRNTRGVTSFVGPGSKPIPLSEAEILSMGIEKFDEVSPYAIGDTVRVIAGPFEDSVGQISEINMHKKTVIVRLSLFGRETPVEIDFTQVKLL